MGAPPNGRGPMIFYAQNAKNSPFFSLATLAIHLKPIFNKKGPKHANINDLYLILLIYYDFLSRPPIDKILAPLGQKAFYGCISFGFAQNVTLTYRKNSSIQSWIRTHTLGREPDTLLLPPPPGGILKTHIFLFPYLS